jgi:hypothetical protein
MRSRRRVAIALALLATTALAAGCSREEKPQGSRAFCRAADDYNTELERAKQQRDADVERQLPLVRELARTAPKAIADDARTFVDALGRVEADPSVREDPDIKRAVDNVNRYANQACNVYERDSGL